MSFFRFSGQAGEENILIELFSDVVARLEEIQIQWLPRPSAKILVIVFLALVAGRGEHFRGIVF